MNHEDMYVYSQHTPFSIFTHFDFLNKLGTEIFFSFQVTRTHDRRVCAAAQRLCCWKYFKTLNNI